jgi:hypothetical protein
MVKTNSEEIMLALRQINKYFNAINEIWKE